MKTAETVKDTRAIIKEWKKQGLSVGLVPTMGFLHEGHESLIRRSAAENDRTVVSIFVNPMQFGKNEDLETYPRDFERDSRICERAGADLIFHPQPEEMYPPDFFTYTDRILLRKGFAEAIVRGIFAACVQWWESSFISRRRIGLISDRKTHSSLRLSEKWCGI